MLASILAFLSQTWIGQLVSAALAWWQQKQQQQNNANTAETNAETQHQTDGAQSVEDKTSTDAQNAALDQLQDQMENPTPVVVTNPGGKKP